MASTPVESGFSFVRRGYDPAEVDERFDELYKRVATSEQRAAHLKHELEGAAEQAAELILQLDSERDRAVALDHQLNQVRQQYQAVHLMLHQASKTRDAMLSEAEATLEEARLATRREAGQITTQAMDKASKMIAEANRESMMILDAGREKLRTVERDATQRISYLDAQHGELTRRLHAMDTVYTELMATLRLVAETSNEKLRAAQSSIELLKPSNTQETEPPRVMRRLHTLRGWSYDRTEESGEIPGGDAGSAGADGL